VGVVWSLLFFNVLGSGNIGALHIPHSVEQVLTQGALPLAFILVLTINPKLRVRPNLFLGLYTLLTVVSLMMSVRFVSVGTDYRVFRLVGFFVVMWLLTPWWGRDDLLLLWSQARFLVLIMVSVVVGLFLAPGQALEGGRLAGEIWPIGPTQVAHYTAELTGLMVLLWLCGIVGRRVLFVLVPALGLLLLTHTRTALIAALLGLLVAALSLFTGSRRVRRVFAAVLVTVAIIGVPLSPFIVNYLARGENSAALTSLTGRTNHWALVLAEPRPETNKIFGSGMSNDEIDGQAIDSSWLDIYQNQGIVGDVIVGAIFLVLLFGSLFRPRGPARAIALFLVVYCLFASITETGMGEASQYALDLTVAASLLAPVRPTLARVRRARGLARLVLREPAVTP
jgi:O-antigen ligase